MSILGWRLNRWLLGTHCSLLLYKSSLSLDSFISCEHGASKTHWPWLLAGTLHVDLIWEGVDGE